jgi:hypothetical protein
MNVQLGGKGLPHLHRKKLPQFLGSRSSDCEHILVGFAKGIAGGTAGGRQLLGHLAAFADAVENGLPTPAEMTFRVGAKPSRR